MKQDDPTDVTVLPNNPFNLKQVNILFSNSNFPYAFSNENVSAMLNLDLTGQDVLAVCSGGDYVFESFAHGAHSVDTFDINIKQSYVLELKLNMIKYLPCKAFYTYFWYDPFNFEIIKPIYNKLSPETQHFVSNVCPDRFAEKYTNAHKHISYLQDKNTYTRLAKTLPNNLKFYNINVFDIPTTITKKYDLILLSNIYFYLYPELIGNHNAKRQKIYDNLLKPLAHNNIKETGGAIYFDYDFNGVNHKMEQSKRANTPASRLNLENNHIILPFEIPSVNADIWPDIVQTFRVIHTR